MGSSDEETSTHSEDATTHKAAAEAFEICIKYLEQQPDTNSYGLMLLHRLHSTAAHRRSTIT